MEVNQEYINKLNISCINITQLPMLTVPRNPTNTGKYLPYIIPELSHIYNSFDSIVKNKYDLRDKTENQGVLKHTIIYLNNTTLNNFTFVCRAAELHPYFFSYRGIKSYQKRLRIAFYFILFFYT